MIQIIDVNLILEIYRENAVKKKKDHKAQKVKKERKMTRLEPRPKWNRKEGHMEGYNFKKRIKSWTQHHFAL